MNLKMTINEIVKVVSKRITKREVNLIASKYEISTDEKSKSQVVSELIEKLEQLNEEYRHFSEVIAMYQFFCFVQAATKTKYYGRAKNSVLIKKDLEAEFFVEVETVEVETVETVEVETVETVETVEVETVETVETVEVETVEVVATAANPKRSKLPAQYTGHNKDLTQYKRVIQLKKYGLIVMFKDDLSCNPLVLGKWGFCCYAGDSEMRKGTYSNRERILSSKESKAITKAWEKMKRIKA